MSANQEIIAELRRVLGERDAAREQLDLTKRELSRWVDREAQAVRECDELRAQRDLALGRLQNEIKAANQARMAEERARESLDELDAAIYECLPSDYDDDSPLDCVEHAADRLRDLAQERDEALAKLAGLPAWQHACEQSRLDLAEAEAVIARRETQLDEARAEVERLREMAHDFEAMRQDRDHHASALKQERREVERLQGDVWALTTTLRNLPVPSPSLTDVCTDAYRRGAEAMREACAGALLADGLVLSRERAAKVVRALPIPEEP